MTGSGLVIPQPTERQRLANQIDAAFVFAGGLRNVQRLVRRFRFRLVASFTLCDRGGVGICSGSVRIIAAIRSLNS